MKAFYQQKLEELKTKKKELGEQVQKSTDLDAVKSIHAKLGDINEEVDAISQKLADIESNESKDNLEKAMNDGKTFNVLGAFDIGKQSQTNGSEADCQLDYRKSFMNYVLKGQTIPSEVLQKANVTTMTTDIGSVIPTTIMNQIIQKIKTSGQIFSRIRNTNIRGGVSYPTSSLIPTASWVAEGAVAGTQKKTTGSIIFNYYKVQVIVAVSLEADITSLDMFEQQVVEDVTNAILVAIEKSVINGTGTNEPKGIFKETKALSVNVLEADINKYTTYTEIYSKLSRAYKSGATWLLTQTDWDMNIIGMVDANGQPIARVTMGLDGVPVERLLGLPVVLVDDDYIEPFGIATTGDCFGALVNFNMYGFNSNMQISIKRYFDENTDMWKTKATAIGDGKMLDINGLVLLKK